MNPKHIHLVGAKHVMRYLKGTLDYGLRYASNGKIILHEIIDSDWEGSGEYRKRNLGCCFSLGSGMISWFSRNQSSVSLSTIEAEYIAACSSCSKALWIHNMLA